MNNLSELCHQTFDIIKCLKEVAIQGLESIDQSWLTYLHLGKTQFECLHSVLILLEKERYKDCFILIRSVFESYFFLLLMMHGKIYREIRRYKIIPEPGKTSPTSRDETLEKWKRDRESGDARYKKVINFNKCRVPQFMSMIVD